MNRAIIVGSPRSRGRCAALANELFETCIEEYPNDQVSLIPLSSLTVSPCQGCNFCKASEDYACCVDDDMVDIREVLDEADELIVVSPVYFAGAPATLKALLDRLQPYFWTDARRGNLRPATLHVIGEGHDPFGFDPLVVTVKSALFTAGFKLDRVLNWVGKIDVNGTILQDAEVQDVAWQGVQDAQNKGVQGAQDKDAQDVQDKDAQGTASTAQNNAKPTIQNAAQES